MGLTASLFPGHWSFCARGDALPVKKATTDAAGQFRFSNRHELGWKSIMIPGKVEYKAAPNVTVTAPGTFV